jgi:S1-C subfamily serine protease
MFESECFATLSAAGGRPIGTGPPNSITRFALFIFLFGFVVSAEASAVVSQPKPNRQSLNKPPAAANTPPNANSVIEIEQLKADLARTDEALSELKKRVDKPRKDIWDKLSAISGILSGGLIALIGIYATLAFNRRQLAAKSLQKKRELRILEVQTLGTFFSYLASSDDKMKEAALIAIAALGNGKLATKLARIFGDVGSKEALSKLASSFATSAKLGAELALADLFSTLRASVVMVGHPASGTGYFVDSSGLLVTNSHVLNVPMVPPGNDQQNAESTSVRTFDERTLPATVLSIDPASETAILRATILDPVSPLRLRQSAIEIGTSAIAVGMIDGRWAARSGHVTAMQVTFANHADLIAVQMDSGPGTS